MQLRMWMYDLAREQSPSLEFLHQLCQRSLAHGYNAIGLYLEHRFAYPSAPWMHGTGCVKPAMVRELEDTYPDLQIVPFLNLLGHFEGMLFTEEGRLFAEERFGGMQACPSQPAFVAFARQLIDDTLAAFRSPLVHIGGDETLQLGKCTECEQRESKAAIYGEHFGPLAEYVIAQGRRPAVWGDMFFDHPEALASLPKETLIFDWEYFIGPWQTSKPFFDAGFEVVFSPTIFTYSATWMHLPQAERNVREHIQAAHDLGAYGVCVTTWECGLFGNYASMLPAIDACGDLMSQEPPVAMATPPVATENLNAARWKLENYAHVTEASAFLRSYLLVSERHEEWARLMGVELQTAGGLFAYTGHRSVLKTRLLLWANPFLAWFHHAEELCGPVGDHALDILERAIGMAPDADMRGVSEFGKLAIQFVRHAEASHQAYARREPGEAVRALAPARQVFESLEAIAIGNNLRCGGSLADIARCQVAKEHVEKVVRRIHAHGDGSLGYLPSFEHITHPKSMPHDQGAWWRMNHWGNE
ncbi:MAG: family 20 glycosylhydrolase [Fimbriimonas sp.]